MRVATLTCNWLPSTLINFELVQILMRVKESFRYLCSNIQSTLMQLLLGKENKGRPAKTWTRTVGAQNKDTEKVDSSNHCHTMIHHQNADAMVLASVHLTGIPPWTSTILNIIRGWMPLKRTLARTMASAFWWRITVMPKSLENHWKNQKVGLLCSTVVYSVVGDMDEVAIDLASFQVCPMEVFTGDTL